MLLVDDSVDACIAQSMLLRMRGYDVQTATSGRDALVAYENFQPDIVLMDLGMPEMSGYDVVRQLRGKPGGDQSLFIALSGRGEEEDRAKAREAGFHRYAIKPVDLADLEQMFRPSPAVRNRTDARRPGQRLDARDGATDDGWDASGRRPSAADRPFAPRLLFAAMPELPDITIYLEALEHADLGAGLAPGPRQQPVSFADV